MDSHALDVVLFPELYYSRQPLLFVLFFFTVHFTFRHTRLLIFLVICQLLITISVYTVVLDGRAQQIRVHDLSNTRVRKLEVINRYPKHVNFTVSDESKKRFSETDQFDFDIEEPDKGLLDSSPSVDIEPLPKSLKCSMYRNEPLFGNRFVFSLLEESEYREKFFMYGHMHYTHYIICQRDTGEYHFYAMNKYRYKQTRKRNYVSSSEEALFHKDDFFLVEQFSVSVKFIIFLQCMYSVFGIVTSFLICRLFSIPKFYKSFSFTTGYRWINFTVELGLLFSSFLYVDEYIPETRFPIGIYRTFIVFTKISFILYFLNRNVENVENSWSKSRQMYNYDRCYLHWLFCCSFLFGTHLVFFVHGYYLTLISLCGLLIIYALMHLFYRYEEERFVYHYPKHQYFWHRVADACTRIENDIFIN